MATTSSNGPSVSIVMIVKNEEKNLADCLQSVSWADEIVIMDSGSTDSTESIAKQFGAKFLTNTDWQGYGPQRQMAQAHATGDWVFVIDADERVTPGLAQEVREVVQTNQQDSAYEIKRLPYCFGKFIRHGGWYPGLTTRLYPRLKADYGNERVHERPHFKEPIKLKRLQSDMLHYTYEDLEHYLVKSARYAAEHSKQRFDAGKRTSILASFGHGIAKFLQQYFFKLGFLDGRHGFLLAILSAHSTFVKHVNLWTREQESRSA
jgi:(heptosyl)LPS beta-1,4-glucosyltransferase